MRKRTPILALAAIVVVTATPAMAVTSRSSGPADQANAQAKEVVAYWTPERRAAAIPRDLALDERGQGHIRAANGRWVPYGGVAASTDPTIVAFAGAEPAAVPVPMARPGGGSGDKAGPAVSQVSPSSGATLATSSITFTASASDGSGVKSVSTVITFPSGSTRSYAMTGSNGTYSTTLNGFTDSSLWEWHVVAKDSLNNTTTTSPKWSFTVSTSGSTGGGGTSVADATWTGGGAVQTAAGRIYFQMPSKGTQWGGYVCSGTAVSDGGSDNTFSLVLTAAHCVYDDAKKVFARNVLFIPNQSGTKGTGTDTNCANDPIGCWVPSYGVVDSDWTTQTFPDNIQWDHAYYVVPNSGAHTVGLTPAVDQLEVATPAMTIGFDSPTPGTDAQAMGYSYSQDPLFRYCREGLGTTGSVNWWLGSCGLSGGASGGPWLQPITNGNGTIVSVNSWGYTNQPGMAGPKLNSTEATCLNTAARSPQTPMDRGYIASCP